MNELVGKAQLEISAETGINYTELASVDDY